MAATAEIREMLQLCFYGMYVQPWFFYYLFLLYFTIFYYISLYITIETHLYLRKISSNILELCRLCIPVIWRMLQVYQIRRVKFTTNFSNFYLPKPDVHYLNIWRKINVVMFQRFGFSLSKVHVCMCLRKKPPFIWFT